MRAILTNAGAEFVTPLSVSALTGEKVFQDLFSLTDEAEMGHIQLSRAADLVVVAPATADLMAKLANGHANDLASTALLATDKPVLMAPAMNVRMWNHPATQRNLKTLKKDGVMFIGPDDGEMACGEFGPGRMAEPLAIAAAIENALAAPGPLDRHEGAGDGGADAGAARSRCASSPIARRASRAMRSPMRWRAAGAETTLVSGPVEIAAPSSVKLLKVQTAREMLAACEVRFARGCGRVHRGGCRLAARTCGQQQDQEDGRWRGTCREARSPIPTFWPRIARRHEAAVSSSSALPRKPTT